MGRCVVAEEVWAIKHTSWLAEGALDSEREARFVQLYMHSHRSTWRMLCFLQIVLYGAVLLKLVALPLRLPSLGSMLGGLSAFQVGDQLASLHTPSAVAVLLGLRCTVRLDLSSSVSLCFKGSLLVAQLESFGIALAHRFELL
jgi:hypothetical protein